MPSTTTLTYKVYPSASNGISRASSGSTAWSNSAYTELVPANTITSIFYICALTFMMTDDGAIDSTHQFEVIISSGLSNSEVEIVVIPITYRLDSVAGHFPLVYVPFEPIEIEANTRLSVKIRQSPTSTITYTGIKILYLN